MSDTRKIRSRAHSHNNGRQRTLGRRRLKNRITAWEGISVVIDTVETLRAWVRERHLKAEARTLIENNIRFKAIGRIHDLPGSVKDTIASLEADTMRSTGMTLYLALSYSGREDILSAAKTLAKRAALGQLKHEDITEEMFSSCLYTSGAPDPDLLIRTGGEKRISNFLLWQLAYTEIYVTDVLWPDFTNEHLLEAIRDYQRRERRFGQVKEEKAVAAG